MEKNFQCNGHCPDITTEIFYDFIISDDLVQWNPVTF